eukprot:1138862-Pelagomonas_calceolata.AAC.3
MSIFLADFEANFKRAPHQLAADLKQSRTPAALNQSIDATKPDWANTKPGQSAVERMLAMGGFNIVALLMVVPLTSFARLCAGTSKAEAHEWHE